MVDLTRRKTVIGLGLLATGSGATFTSAAFQSSTQQESDLRVVVDQNLQFGANPDLDPDDVENITGNPDFFDEDGNLDESSDGAFFNDGNETANPSFNQTNESGVGNDSNIGDDGFDPDDSNDDGGFNEGFEPGLPKAFAGEVGDGDFAIRAAVQIGESATFEELLRVSNATDSTVEVGIAYDRNGEGNGTNGNYGEDIDLDGELNDTKAQKIYQFHTSDDAPNSDDDSDSSEGNKLISPNPGKGGINSGQGTVDFDNADDAPNNVVTLEPGEFVNLDLVVNSSDDASPSLGSENDIDVTQDILDTSDINQGAFGFQTDTVQIMDVITVVSRPV